MENVSRGIRMERLSCRRWWRSLPLAFALAAGANMEGIAPEGFAAPPLYWCPQRPPDQQYGATLEPGCVPLVEKEKKDQPTQNDKAAALPQIKVESIQAETTSFMNDYRRYLACCATDPNSLEDLEDLDDRASAILKAAQTGLFSEKMKLKGFTLSEMIPPVARARDQLHEIKKRLEHIAVAKDKLDRVDSEGAGRERRRIQDAEDSITRDFGAKPPPPGAKTGMEIGQTPPTGTHIGHVPPTGGEVGMSGRTGRDLGYTPPTNGREIGQTPPTGYEIGKTGKAGPAIGESDLNSRPSGATSTLGGSLVDSDMQNRALGSNISPSMVDSDLQSRPSPPPADVPLSTVGSSLKGRTP